MSMAEEQVEANSMRSILSKYLPPLGISDYDNMLYEEHSYSILCRDVLNAAIKDKMTGTEQERYQKAGELTAEIVREARNDGVLILDSWSVKVEDADCSGCPAFRWVVHRDGIHDCRLGFEIKESAKSAAPISPCLRPLTVGASYVIARELGRPEPMVGKLDKWQYDQYEAEKREFEASAC